MKLNEKIKALRKERGYTQTQVADKMGIKLCNLASYEEGRAYPKPEIIKIFIDFYRIPKTKIYNFLFE